MELMNLSLIIGFFNCPIDFQGKNHSLLITTTVQDVSSSLLSVGALLWFKIYRLRKVSRLHRSEGNVKSTPSLHKRSLSGSLRLCLRKIHKSQGGRF